MVFEQVFINCGGIVFSDSDVFVQMIGQFDDFGFDVGQFFFCGCVVYVVFFGFSCKEGKLWIIFIY